VRGGRGEGALKGGGEKREAWSKCENVCPGLCFFKGRVLKITNSMMVTASGSIAAAARQGRLALNIHPGTGPCSSGQLYTGIHALFLASLYGPAYKSILIFASWHYFYTITLSVFVHYGTYCFER